MTDGQSKRYDVIITGGGLAGLTLACLLASSGMRIAVIDAADPNAPMIGDERTTAISYGSQKILDQAGVWPQVKAQGCPIRDIEILDGDSPVLLNFLSDEVGGKEFGTIVLNADIRNALNETRNQHKNIDYIAPARVSGFSLTDDAVRVQLESGEGLTAQLAVGADGRNSFMRDWLDIECRRKDYKQTAVICIARHENPHNNVAVEHFWPGGPFAILPMSDDKDGAHRSSIVFTEHQNGDESLKDSDRVAFNLALRARFPERYGAVEMIGERTAYPLTLVHASEYIAPRMALMADAAHGIHPIAGQGLNLGFRDVKELGALLNDAYSGGADLGAPDLLQTYQRRRRPDNMAMVAATDALVRLFSNKFPPFRIARKIGLKIVGRLPRTKRFFMKQAMADRG